MSLDAYAKLAGLLQLQSLHDIEIAHYPLVQPKDNKHEPFILLERKHLVVPLKPLLSCYAEACSRFARRLPDELWDVTSILLLQNVEHLSALNARRRLLLATVQPDLDRELRFCETLLHIPTHAKAASLWHHRRWLISWRSSGRPLKGPLLPSHLASLPPDQYEKELSLAAQACEVYARNYAAWAHRACIVLAGASDQRIRAELDFACSWLDRHIADHSAAQYLVALTRQVSEHGKFDHVSDLVARYPDRETPWLLVRQLSKLEAMRSTLDQHMFPPTGQSVLRTDDRLSSAQRHALRASLWFFQKSGQIAFSQGKARQIAGTEDVDVALVNMVRSYLRVQCN